MNTREVLYKVIEESQQNTLNNALDKLFTLYQVEIKEKAYITNASHQVFRHKLRFEALIFLYSHKGRDLSKECQNILLIALCEIFCMQSIPLHASINEAVELAKKYASKEVALVNAILRKIDKEFPFKEFSKEKFMKEIKFLYPKKTKLELEACYASLPSFILDILRKQYDKDFAEKYMETLNEIPYYSYRFNITKEDWEVKRNELSQTSILHNYFGKSGYAAPINSKKVVDMFENGILSYQGASSQIAVEKIVETLGKEKMQNLWDACCGVGGKSFSLREQGIGIKLATDTSKKRIEVYNKNCKRLGFEEIITEVTEMQKAKIDKARTILIDAPCSGTGTLCSNPDLRYKITKKSIAEIIITQEELLSCAYEKLEKEGHIIYLTCSLNKNENENLIKAFSEKKKMTILKSEYINPVVCGADTIYFAILQK